MKKLLFCIAFLNVYCCQAQVGIIITVCGNGTAGYSGDGGSAVLAKINLPHGIIADTFGNFYFSDQSNSCIRKVTEAGIITTIAGTGTAGFSGDGGPATLAKLNTPYKAVIDKYGNLLISDCHNFRIRKVNTSGIISTIAGNGVLGYSGDGGPATNASFYYICALAVDSSNNIYLTDDYNQRVRKIDATTGIITTIAGNGTLGYSGDGGQATNATFSYPNYMCIDKFQNLYISDNGNGCVRKVNTSGIITTVVGIGVLGYNGDGIPATSAQLNYSAGITLDSAGNLFICDYNNNRIRVVNTSGIINTIGGIGIPGFSGDGGPATTAELNGPVDVVFSNAGLLLISDYYNQRIREIKICNPPILGLIMGSPTVCAGASISLSDTSLVGTWSSVNSTGTVSGTGIVTGLRSGIDTITYSKTNTCGTSRVTTVLTIDSLPNPGFISGLDSVCVDSAIILSPSISGGFWSSSNITIAEVFSGSVVGYHVGIDTIKYTILNGCGNSSVQRTVFVDNSCTTDIQNVTYSENIVYVYPNPVFDVLYINSMVDNSTYRVIDFIGRNIAKGDLISGINQINIKDYSTGVYFLEVTEYNGRHSMYKVEKE